MTVLDRRVRWSKNWTCSLRWHLVLCSAILACGIILAMDGLIAAMIGMMIFPPHPKYYERGWYPWRYALKFLPLTFVIFLLLTRVLH